MFGRKQEQTEQPAEVSYKARAVLQLQLGQEFPDSWIEQQLLPIASPLTLDTERTVPLSEVTGVFASFQDAESASRLLDQIIEIREHRKDGTPYVVLATELSRLKELGSWLHFRAKEDILEGLRLLPYDTPATLNNRLHDMFQAVHEKNAIRMPETPEVDDTDYKYIYTMSPSLREVVRKTREYSENGVRRIYLLGGPGSGKTTLAYYYWVTRGSGNFVTVNLTAESTGDKAAMKSLLCGHVPGASPGVGAREGALSFARDGVCFLDESHGVTGVVMQVLMEVLDSGQFLPFGATKKRQLDCAVIFASNRSWDHLRSLIHPDEHARLGASILAIADLKERPEDLLAVLATTLSRFEGQCSTWRPPLGLTPEAWELIERCPWRGNTRTLIRVIETACVEFGVEHGDGVLLEARHIQKGIDLWEPEDASRYERYASYTGEGEERAREL